MSDGRSRYRVAIIGCGRMAHGHADAYNRDPRAELVACADISADAARAFATQFGISRQYLDYRQMLEQERPDIVSICTHHQLHAPMTIDTAKLAAPKAILCEKPIALDLESADAMIAACEATGTLLLIGHQRRFGPQYVGARDAVASGVLGDVLLVEAFGHPRSTLLVDSTHTVDLVRFFLGDPVGAWVIGQIDAREHRSSWGQRIEDCALGWIGLSDGTRLLLGAGSVVEGVDQTTISPRQIAGGTYHRIIVHGSRGRVEVHGDAPVEGGPLVELFQGDTRQVLYSAADWERDQATTAVDREVAAMIDCLEQPGLAHPLGARSARDTLEILLAIYESSHRRELVRLPLGTTDNGLFTMLDAGEV